MQRSEVVTLAKLLTLCSDRTDLIEEIIQSYMQNYEMTSLGVVGDVEVFLGDSLHVKYPNSSHVYIGTAMDLKWMTVRGIRKHVIVLQSTNGLEYLSTANLTVVKEKRSYTEKSKALSNQSRLGSVNNVEIFFEDKVRANYQNTTRNQKVYEGEVKDLKWMTVSGVRKHVLVLKTATGIEHLDTANISIVKEAQATGSHATKVSSEPYWIEMFASFLRGVFR